MTIKNTNNMIPFTNKTVFSPLIGNLVEFSPIFSNDTKFLYTIWNNEIRSYSTATGEFVQTFTGMNGDPIGLQLNPQNDQMVTSCSNTGHICQWINEDSVNIKSMHLNIEKGWSIRWFNLYYYKKKDQMLVLIAYEISKEEDLYIATYSFENGNPIEILNARASFNKNSISSGNNIIASISNKNLYLTNIVKKNRKRKIITMSKNLNCVSLGGDVTNQRPIIVAAGSVEGIIYIWSEPLQNEIPPTSYHWHPLPIKSLAFSSSSSKFFSGGKENVLLLWTMGIKKPKFLPRLSGEINHIVFSFNNDLCALSLSDNSIQIITMQELKISAVIQHITMPRINILKNDPTTNGLVIGGREGHIQVYNPESDSILYHLDITMLNQITAVDEQNLIRPEIQCLAFSFNKKWLVTSEESSDKFEVRLKFWRIIGTKYTLVTCIEYPHSEGIKSLTFSPCSNLCVSCGGDKKFRIWQINIDEKGWRCLNVGMYKDYSCETSNFSIDSSILGVAFESSLTLWSYNEMTIRATLKPTKLSPTQESIIRQINFGGKDRFHLVGTSSKQGLFVWDIISLSLLWQLSLDITQFFTNHLTHHWAIFTSGTLFIFDPLKQKPEHKVKWSWNSEPVAATFGSNSRIYILDNHFQLFELKDKDENRRANSKQILYQEHIPKTMYSLMLAEKYTSEIKEIEQKEHRLLGNQQGTIINQFLTAPAHTMPSMDMFCKDFLSSLLSIPKKQNEQMEVEEINDIEDIDLVSEEDTDYQEKVPPLPTNEEIDDNINKKSILSELKIISKQKVDWIDLLN